MTGLNDLKRCGSCGYIAERCNCAGQVATRRPRAKPNRYGFGQAPCGTSAAVRRHHRRGEPLCEACAAEQRRVGAERKGCASGNHTPDLREIRNGLPEFVPYVYRGTGYDTLTAHLDDGEPELAAAS